MNLSLDPAAIPDIEASMHVVEQVIAEDRNRVYGINTGFGLLANTKIAPEDLEVLQKSIVLSHAAGIGKFYVWWAVRWWWCSRLPCLSRGYSGIRLKVINALIDLVNAQVYPHVCHRKAHSRCFRDLCSSPTWVRVLLVKAKHVTTAKIITGLEAMQIAGGLEPNART